jgi:CheY-like chemotaxis protein
MATIHIPPNPHSSAWVALVSTDPRFRNRFHELLEDPALPARLAIAIDVPFAAITETELSDLRRSAPDLLVVDLESDPKRGLEFIRSVLDSGVASAVMAASTDLSQELLLQALQSGVMEPGVDWPSNLSKPGAKRQRRRTMGGGWLVESGSRRRFGSGEPFVVRCIQVGQVL